MQGKAIASLKTGWKHMAMPSQGFNAQNKMKLGALEGSGLTTSTVCFEEYGGSSQFNCLHRRMKG